MEEESRLERGYRKLKEVDGKAGEAVKESLSDISPDLVKYMIEYSFGDVYSREGLGLKSKEIAVVAALTALGNARPQLKVHINGALNVGCSVNDIKEVIIQMTAYSGFPTAINAMNALKEVLEERKSEGIEDYAGEECTNEVSPMERYQAGVRELSQLDKNQAKLLEDTYKDFSPALTKLIIQSYADIIGRNNLSKRYRQIATIAALTALGNAEPQLRFHINSGLNVGLTEEEIKEIMLLMTVYSGFPSAISGMNVLKNILRERVQI
ncbi:carboxymuconolactone decarboxylase family protein [Clostridium sp. 19966]|uniref:carboxymuconolactone decarboxylase family protein n=1 Tax=Clostridium sp. 19966 TaxID=2768166 RepID=UPI0028DDCDB7|nr:carboxymuconolactone decarboxylase family protein [Clostridium sp. 19966]MDT8719322.1 carboxymuconolactone decarboxylase family protein [Clostridium sp. 19966]